MTTEASANAAPEAQANAGGVPAAAAPDVPAAPLAIGEPDAAPAAAAPPPPAGDASRPVAYDATGDVGLDMALDFIGNLGIGPDDPAMVAAINGNFDLMKAKLGGIGDKAKGWERYLALAEKSHGETKAKHEEKAAKDRAAIHATVGGEEAWAAISKWAGANAEPAEKAAVNAALAQGGLIAKAVAAHLGNLYAKAAGTTVDPSNPVDPSAAGKADASGGPLSATEYGKAVMDLRAKLGYRFEESSQYVQLQQRRVAGVRTGR